MKRRAGFTLLEVLIALAILAIASTAVISQSGQSIRQLHRLEQKSVALWIADNQIAYLRGLPSWPSTGRRSEQLEMSGALWNIDTEVTATSEPWLRKIDVSVAVDGSNDPLVSMTAYRGRY